MSESTTQSAPASAKEQTDQLVGVLKSDAPLKEKVDACRLLGQIGTAEAVPALAGLLGDEKLSHMARYGLEPIPDPAVDDALRDALGKLEGGPLVGVIGSIGVRRDAKAVAGLVKMLGSSDADVVRTAARSLGRIATPEAVAALKETLADAAAGVRLAVADGCLASAEALLAQGKRGEAGTIYQAVAKADLPKQFRVAAAQGMLQTRQ